MKKVFALALALMLLLSVPALAAASVLKPTDDFYVNDAANVLTNETVGHIVLNNDALYKACGAQIVIVTVDTTGSTKLENYAYKLFNDWKIGGSKNYGFLLVMAIRDDDYWYTIGSGLDQYLTAGDVGELIDQYLEPNFARQDYDKGARAFFDALFADVARVLKAGVSVDETAYTRYVAKENAQNAGTQTGAVGGATSSSDSEEGSAIVGFLFIVLVVVVIVLIVRSRKRRRATYNNPNPTVIVNNPVSSSQSYNRGFLAGMLSRSARQARRTPPPPPVQTYTQVPPTGRTNTATRPTQATRPVQTPPAQTRGSASSGQSYGGFSQPPGRASSAGRSYSAGSSSSSSRSSSSSSRSSSGGSIFGGFSGGGRSSGGFGRSGGFGGGRSGGGGSTRGSGGGRHR
ncbi:MAG: TPM domain-containing protein [Clostridia bacterium]|nr:TPM domain-containing protein [Clostridia bacterium]